MSLKFTIDMWRINKMAKGNTAKLQTLTDNLKYVTVVNTPTGTATLYIALFSTDPGGTGSGTEVSYSGYARQEIEFGTAAMNGTQGEIKNTNAIEFAAVPTASGNVTHVAIFTAATGGILLYYGALGAAYALNQGVQPTVPIGNLSVFEN